MREGQIQVNHTPSKLVAPGKGLSELKAALRIRFFGQYLRAYDIAMPRGARFAGKVCRSTTNFTSCRSAVSPLNPSESYPVKASPTIQSDNRPSLRFRLRRTAAQQVGVTRGRVAAGL